MASSDRVPSKSDFPLASLIAPELLLGIATAPFVVSLVGGKAMTEAVREIGVLSEEIFRGDRLPLLPFPTTADPSPDPGRSI